MIARKFSFFLVLLFLCLQIGCEDNDGPTGLVSGTLSGYVSTSSWRDTVDRSGIEVIAEGTPFRTLADSTGIWKLVNVPTGVYSILIRKEGYGYTKISNLQFVGGGEFRVNSVSLTENPLKSITALSLSVVANTTLYATGTIVNHDSKITYVRWFFGHGEPVASDGATYFYSATFEQPPSNSFNRALSTLQYGMRDLIATGDTVHVALYVVSSTWDSYFDPASNKYCYTTGINPVPARASFVMP